MDIQSVLFLHPFPADWLIQDIVVLLVSLGTLAFLVTRDRNPGLRLLEAFGFVFLYAALYENAAGVMGLYTFGQSFVMIGYVPASIPLIEVCVLLLGLNMLEKTALPVWSWPLVIGLFGMLQDFSLDPLAVRQVHEVAGVTSARWNWLFDASTDASILGVPTFNFPGWILIMAYSATMLLVGRWLYRRSGERLWVGIVYPPVSMIVALGLMASPLSALLLWFGPVFARGGAVEWVMLALHLGVPLLLIGLFARRSGAGFTRADLPLVLLPMALHLSDIAFAIAAHPEVLWLSLLATAAHAAIFRALWRGSGSGRDQRPSLS